MTLPEVAEELRLLAVQHNIPRLNALADEIKRRPMFTKSPITSAHMTPALKQAIQACHKANPLWPQAYIARKYNVNPGRVSEVLRGKRK